MKDCAISNLENVKGLEIGVRFDAVFTTMSWIIYEETNTSGWEMTSGVPKDLIWISYLSKLYLLIYNLDKWMFLIVNIYTFIQLRMFSYVGGTKKNIFEKWNVKTAWQPICTVLQQCNANI